MPFEAEVIVKLSGAMFLNDVQEIGMLVFLAAGFAGRFRRYAKVTFLFIVFQSHRNPWWFEVEE